jgi:hypothetical protein
MAMSTAVNCAVKKLLPLDESWDDAAPRPDALIESLRSFGYSPESAIADLIDNSISAGARTIDLHFRWEGIDSHVAIVDDGRGMDEANACASNASRVIEPIGPPQIEKILADSGWVSKLPRFLRRGKSRLSRSTRVFSERSRITHEYA